MLFNFLSAGQSSNQMGSFLGQALAIVDFAILDDLAEQTLDNTVENVPQEKVTAEMKKLARTRFEAGLDDSSLQDRASGESNIRKLFTYKIDSAVEEQKKRPDDGEVDKDLFSLPIIYKTQESESNEGEQVKAQSQETRYQRVKSMDFDFEKRASMQRSSQGHFWMKVQVCIQGVLMEDLFMQNLMLNLNQAIYDYLIERYLYERFLQPALEYDMSRELVNESADPVSVPQEKKAAAHARKGSQLKLPKINISKFQTAVPGDKSIGVPILVKHGKDVQRTEAKVVRSQIAELFESSLATHSPIAQRYETALVGDAVELNQSFSFALIKSLHNYFKLEVNASLDSVQFDAQAKEQLIEGFMSFIVIIRHVSNTD